MFFPPANRVFYLWYVVMHRRGVIACRAFALIFLQDTVSLRYEH